MIFITNYEATVRETVENERLKGQFDEGPYHAQLSLPADGFTHLSGVSWLPPRFGGAPIVETYLTPMSAEFQYPERRFAVLRDKKLLDDFRRLAESVTASSPPPRDWEDAIVRFADEHGWLTKPDFFKPDGEKETRYGESMSVWWRELDTFRRIYELYETIAIANEDHRILEMTSTSPSEARKLLGKLIEWSDRHVAVSYEDWRKPGVPTLHLIASRRPSHHPELLKLFKPGDSIEPARVVMHRWLADRSAGQFSVFPALVADGSGRSDLRVVPTSLRGSIYLRLSQKIVGREHPRVCGNPDCPNGGFFTGGRSNKKYCDDNCKAAKHYQDKVAEGRSL